MCHSGETPWASSAGCSTGSPRRSAAQQWSVAVGSPSLRSFRAGRLSDAFGRFVDLANRGDVDSARIALFLQSYGPVLYGKDWDAGPDNVAYWNMLIRNSGTSARPLPEYPATLL